MTQQTLPVRIRLLRVQCQLLQLRRRQITFVIFVGLIKEQELCLFVPCGHARFCDSCARQLFATTKTCGICRQQIDLLVPVFN